MKRRVFIQAPLCILVITFVDGCKHILPWIAKAGDIAEMVRKAIKLLEGGAAMWFEDKPDDDLQKDVTAAISAAKDALEAFEAVGKAADSYSRGDQEEVERNLLAAYRNLYKLTEMIPDFMEAGSLSAPPEGAESPTPVTPDELEVALAGG